MDKTSIIDRVFLQGDPRYDQTATEEVLWFLDEEGITLEDQSHTLKSFETGIRNIQPSGPQKDLKSLVLSLFKQRDITFKGFEQRIKYGIADMIGNKDNLTILVECGPCRIDKGFNYLREENTELWVVTDEFDHTKPDYACLCLFIIKRGPNWEECIGKHDSYHIHQLKSLGKHIDILMS